MFCCNYSTAMMLKNEKNSDFNNKISTESLNYGETYIYPPWSHGGEYTKEHTPLLGYVDGYVETDPYKGEIELYAIAWEFAYARAEGWITHGASPNYVAPCDGHYDFVFTYRYYGFLDINVFCYPPFDAYFDTDISLKFSLKVFSPENYLQKQEVLDEDTYRQNYYTDWDDTIDVSFNDIFVSEGSEVYFSVTTSIEDFNAVAAGPMPHFSEGLFDFTGEFKKVKIVEPCSSGNPPNKPSQPSGPVVCKVGNSYPFTSKTTDPDGDDIYYLFDWGDDTNSGWLGPYPSGTTVMATKTWYNPDTYSVRVKAKDVNDKESEYSEPLVVTVTKSRAVVSQPLEILFDKLTNYLPNLKLFLQRLELL